MAHHHNYRVWASAHTQLVTLGTLTRSLHFGDLANQLRRAGISVVSNIVEGAGRRSDADFARFLTIARASNDEIAAQLEIVGAITGQDVSALLATNASTGRMLSALIRRLRSGG